MDITVGGKSVKFLVVVFKKERINAILKPCCWLLNYTHLKNPKI
jgi:hypothetical protein